LHIVRTPERFLVQHRQFKETVPYLCWLAYFLADFFPLVGLVIFDGIEQSLALLQGQPRMQLAEIVIFSALRRSQDPAAHIPHPLQTQRNAYPASS
jgi:hypothetical protein